MAMVSTSNTINGIADITSDAYNALCSFTLPIGMHIITANVAFNSNDIGYRRIGLSGNGESFNLNRLSVECRQSVSGNATIVSICYIHNAYKVSPLYLMAHQNSGITLANCVYGINVLSMGNIKRYTIPHDFLNI